MYRHNLFFKKFPATKSGLINSFKTFVLDQLKGNNGYQYLKLHFWVVLWKFLHLGTMNRNKSCSGMRRSVTFLWKGREQFLCRVSREKKNSWREMCIREVEELYTDSLKLPSQLLKGTCTLVWSPLFSIMPAFSTRAPSPRQAPTMRGRRRRLSTLCKGPYDLTLQARPWILGL